MSCWRTLCVRPANTVDLYDTSSFKVADPDSSTACAFEQCFATVFAKEVCFMHYDFLMGGWYYVQDNRQYIRTRESTTCLRLTLRHDIKIPARFSCCRFVACGAFLMPIHEVFASILKKSVLCKLRTLFSPYAH